MRGQLKEILTTCATLENCYFLQTDRFRGNPDSLFLGRSKGSDKMSVMLKKILFKVIWGYHFKYIYQRHYKIHITHCHF